VINVRVCVVLQSLDTLTLSFSPDRDRIPSCILRNCSSYLALPLTLTFNQSLSQSRTPSIWKISFIVLLFKKGNKSDIPNYLVIAKLSPIPKLFQKKFLPVSCSIVAGLLFHLVSMASLDVALLLQTYLNLRV